MKICYLTATGNCLYVAKRIGGELLSIPQLMRQEKIEITDDGQGDFMKMEKNGIHFRNEHVSLQDIIIRPEHRNR